MAPENDDLSTPASGDHSQGDGVGLAGGQPAPRPGKTQLDVWADQLADYVVQGVGWLKARTTTRAQTALRAVVYGVVVVVARFSLRLCFWSSPSCGLGRLRPDRALGSSGMARLCDGRGIVLHCWRFFAVLEGR